jgi:hypothetical protein
VPCGDVGRCSWIASTMTEAHDELAERLDLARKRLVNEHIEASRPHDDGPATLLERLLRGLIAPRSGHLPRSPQAAPATIAQSAARPASLDEARNSDDA